MLPRDVEVQQRGFIGCCLCNSRTGGNAQRAMLRSRRIGDCFREEVGWWLCVSAPCVYVAVCLRVYFELFWRTLSSYCTEYIRCARCECFPLAVAR